MKRWILGTFLLLGVLIMLGGVGSGQGKNPVILRVPEQYPHIQAAIDAAPSGSIILIAPGQYREDLKITKSLTLWGAGPEQTIIKGIGEQSVYGGLVTLYVQSPSQGEGMQVTIRGLTLQAPQRATALEVDDDGLQLSLWQDHLSGATGIFVVGTGGKGGQLSLRQDVISGSTRGIDTFIFPAGIDKFQLFIENTTIRMGGHGVGLSLGTSQTLLIGDRIEGAEMGIDVLGGQLSIQHSLIRGNNDGIIVDPLLDSALNLSDSEVKDNNRYGLVIKEKSCFPDALRIQPGEQPPIQGKGNIISGNGLADLCPLDYPWPWNFRTQTTSSRSF